MKFCPDCGSEYRSGYDTCWDCQVPLVDAPIAMENRRVQPVLQERVAVFRSGRRIDAELIRGRLEADGIEATIWSSGLGPWRMESALTEITGVPNDFNSHQVVVAIDDVERARELLSDDGESWEDEVEADDQDGRATLLSRLRVRWAVLGFAFFLLLLVLFAGAGRS